MCLLITLAGLDPAHPVVVASNRDERRDRPAMPPGLWVGERHRALSPRDKRAGGTWLAVGDNGLFAGLTNLAGVPVRDDARSRGDLPHLAVDSGSVDAAVEVVRAAVGRDPFNGFQLLVTDGARVRVLAHAEGRIDEASFGAGSVVVISNEHRVGALAIPGLDAAAEPGLDLEERFARLAPLLLDQGERSGHRILKDGGEYGTVSSSLVGVPTAGLMRGLVWRYAAGQPDQVPYRNYGNLARRLFEG